MTHALVREPFGRMTSISRCLCFFALACLSVSPCAAQRVSDQQVLPRGETTTSVTATFTGHYEGTATNKALQAIPLAIDLTDTNGAFSGSISTTLGIFPIVGGTRQAGAITIKFDANGERGNISAKLRN